jgi:membrane-bound serine protease (ClpP class)
VHVFFYTAVAICLSFCGVPGPSVFSATQFDARPDRQMSQSALLDDSPTFRAIPHATAPLLREFEPALRKRILSAVANQNVAFVLLIAGILCAYGEFSAPGLILPGSLGAVLALLGASALAAFPLSWTGASLILLAPVLCGVEVKLNTRGVLVAGAALAMFFGAITLIETTDPAQRIRPGVALAAAIPFTLATSFLLRIAVRARRNKAVAGQNVSTARTHSVTLVREVRPRQ